MRPRSIRGGRGLGDALYLQAVVRHLVARGERMRAYCDWPDVFLPLGDGVTVAPFRRTGIDLLAHYAPRKGIVGTTQFEDLCRQAGIAEPVDLGIDWTAAPNGLAHELTQHHGGLPVVLVQMPRTPMGRKDGFGADLLPDCRVIQRAVDRLKGRALLVLIGAGRSLHDLTSIDVDLTNKTTVRQLLDVASIAAGHLGYVSYTVPLAEVFNKPAMLVWSRRGLQSGDAYVRQITPQKVLHKSTSQHVIDDWQPEQLDEAFDAFLQ